MTIDVIDLRDFYSQRLGIVARRLINRGIHARWPDAGGQRVLGLGYPTPYLGLFREDSERCIAFMPAAQGVLKWPTARPTLATLVDEFSLPLPDAAVDRILLVHALEMSDDPEGLLREVWRGLGAPRPRGANISNPRGGGGARHNPARGMDSHRQHAVRSRPALFALADHAIAAADLVHADGVGRSTVHAAGRRRLVPALGDGVGARRRGAVAAVCRRSYRGGQQAGLSRDPRQARTHAADSFAGAGAGAVVTATAGQDIIPSRPGLEPGPIRRGHAFGTLANGFSANKRLWLWVP